jgi:hypothetical protein
MRVAVSNVNSILIGGARILWPVCTAVLQFAFACSRRYPCFCAKRCLDLAQTDN